MRHVHEPGLSSPIWALAETDWGFVALAGDPTTLWYVGYPQPNEDAAVAALHAEFGSIGPQGDPGPVGASDVIRAYFAGRPINWAELPVRLEGTPFQIQIWEATRRVDHGMTLTYGELARACGYPRAARAAGSALAVNRAGLLVPCHRIVAAGGIGGYGNWRQRKLALLALEKGGAVTSRINRRADPPIGAG